MSQNLLGTYAKLLEDPETAIIERIHLTLSPHDADGRNVINGDGAVAKVSERLSSAIAHACVALGLGELTLPRLFLFCF